MNIDTERLITEVRLRPALWDSSSVFYKDRDAKISAWQEICKEFIPDFDDKSDSEKKDIEKQVQQRWKTARDAYVRCKATLKNVPPGSGGKKRKTYVYFECMKFLDNKRELNIEDSILSNEESNQNETTGNEEDVVSHPTGNEGAVEPQSSTSVDSNINRNSQKPASNLGRKFTRIKRQKNRNEDEFDREMQKLSKDNAKVMQNDDMAFFYSLLPITNIFSIEQKLIFRQEVLQKALEISRLGLDRPGTSHSITSSDSQHSNSVTLYPVVQSPFQTLPGQTNIQHNNKKANMQCKSEMVDDIDIEEHNIFDNPQLRKIFPDIMKLKEELDYDTPTRTEAGDLHQAKRVDEDNYGDQPATVTDTGLPSTCKYVDQNKSKSINMSKMLKTNKQNGIIQLAFERSSNVVNVSEDEQFINYNQECELMPKKEVLTCKVCCKQSEEEMCKQCVPESDEGRTQCSSVDRNVIHAVDDTKKISETTLVCDTCPYTSICRSDLERHLQRHTEESSLECDYKISSNKTEYKCVRKSQLFTHFRIRTGEKPYKCDFCDYTTARGYHLTNHVNAKHTNEKNYSCDICEHKFFTKTALNHHLQKHTGEKPHKCYYCDFASFYSSGLTTHLRARHPNRRPR